MKATLKFDLTDVGDAMAHACCLKSADMAIILWEIQHNLKRRVLKNCDVDEGGEVDAIFTEIDRMMTERGIIIDELTF
jgi:hypothetical protein